MARNITQSLLYQAEYGWRALQENARGMFKWEGCYLQGSQNYGTDHENSDVDSKLVVIPTVEGMLRGVKLSAEISTELNEKVAVKTFPEFAELFFKGNVNNLEMLFTEYYVGGDLLERVRPHREEIVQAVKRTLVDASLGMMIQKRKSLHKGTETTQPMVEKYGYDPKDAIHILRLSGLIWDTIVGKPFEEALIVEDLFKPFMFSLRNGYMPEPQVTAWADKLILDAKDWIDQAGITNNMEEVTRLRKLVQDIYVDWYKENML